ncbi:hypothetical protein GGI42DRAFT_324080 [Trichoderma sp. SZMC 28013]
MHHPVSERLFRVLSTYSFFFFFSLLHSAMPFGYATEGSLKDKFPPANTNPGQAPQIHTWFLRRRFQGCALSAHGGVVISRTLTRQACKMRCDEMCDGCQYAHPAEAKGHDISTCHS